MDSTYNLSYKRELVKNKTAVAAIGVVFFVLATALGAYVRIPLKSSPVPITLQTFFVILSGAVLGRRLGSYSQAGYIILGLSGLPLFQGAGFGLSYLLGPTGGYLAGFVFSAFLVGHLMRMKDFNMKWTIVSFTAGSTIIYTFGILWLVSFYRMSMASAVSIGILPFIPGDIAKILFAAIIYSKIAQRSKSIFSA